MPKSDDDFISINVFGYLSRSASPEALRIGEGLAAVSEIALVQVSSTDKISARSASSWNVMARYKFWFHDRDKNGQPLDEDILKAAEKVAPLLIRYRKDEIGCNSTANDILQEAVEAASHVTRKRPITNPAGYLVSTYKRSVDKYLDRRGKLIPVDDEFLEDLADSGAAPSPEEWIHDRLILEKLMKLMDPDTRRICRWRLQGYTESEIAKRLGVSPNTVSVRFTRGLKEAARRLRLGKRSRT